MKICLAQIASTMGNVEKNIAHHLDMIKKAITEQADLIIFPELSLTGYAPEIAQATAMEMTDERLSPFQSLSDKHHISIGIGLPIKTGGKPQIGLVLFEAGQTPKCYSKYYLHEDELPFFSAGPNYTGPIAKDENLALAVCYELSVEAHAEAACERGAKIYLASVAKTPGGVDKASLRLCQIAREHGIYTMMVNCVGTCEGQKAGGKSAVWNEQGEPTDVLGPENEGLLFFDTSSKT